MRRRRADLLPTGVLILRTLVEVFGLDGLTLSDWGLREGILLEAARAHEPGALAACCGSSSSTG
jgi:exopolyphosphatase/pppGpp-phosphohydrolase